MKETTNKKKERNNNHEFSMWSFEKPFEHIIVQTTILKRSGKISKSSQRLHLMSNICIFHCCCFASFEFLDRFLKRPFESIHAFKPTFKQLVNTFLYFLSNKICAVGWLQAPSLHIFLLRTTLGCCGDDPLSLLLFQIIINKNMKTPNGGGDW